MTLPSEQIPAEHRRTETPVAVGRQAAVAQVANLPCRRLPVGKASTTCGTSIAPKARRLPTCETADRQSALLFAPWALPRFRPLKCRFDAGTPGASVSITLLLVFMAALLLPCGARAQQLYLQNLGGTELRAKDVAVSAQGYSFIVGNADTAGQGTLVVVETITGFVRAAQTFDFRPTTIAVTAGPDADNAYLFIGGNYNASNGNSRGRVRKYQYTQSTGVLTSLVTYEVYGPSDGATPAADFQEVADLAVDGTGNVVILGRFKGSLSALGSARTGETNWQNFVLKLDGSLGNAGSVGWFQQWGLKSGAPARMPTASSGFWRRTRAVDPW
ncbi:MAG: hypothetical protein L0Z50_41975 [Verrucomicrobiales bacterium]|nr:hypothetical protein [Verrucomicrobiales bacterium]